MITQKQYEELKENKTIWIKDPMKECGCSICQNSDNWNIDCSGKVYHEKGDVLYIYFSIKNKMFIVFTEIEYNRLVKKGVVYNENVFDKIKVYNTKDGMIEVGLR